MLNTKWFLPQNRERIYLVGYLGDGSGGQVFPIRKDDSTFKNKFRKKNRSISKTENKNIHARTIGTGTAKMATDSTFIKVKSATSRGYEEAVDGDSINYSNPNSKTRRGRVGKGVAQTLDTCCNQAVVDNKVRRLTPIECERLQGFPDNWTEFGESGNISDTQRYKMCGNAVTVDVVEAVAKNIIKVIK